MKYLAINPPVRCAHYTCILKATKQCKKNQSEPEQTETRTVLVGQKTTQFSRRTSQTDLQSPHDPSQALRRLFCRNWQTDFKVNLEMQKTKNSQNSFEKREQSWKSYLVSKLLNTQ